MHTGSNVPESFPNVAPQSRRACFSLYFAPGALAAHACRLAAPTLPAERRDQRFPLAKPIGAAQILMTTPMVVYYFSRQ